MPPRCLRYAARMVGMKCMMPNAIVIDESMSSLRCVGMQAAYPRQAAASTNEYLLRSVCAIGKNYWRRMTGRATVWPSTKEIKRMATSREAKKNKYRKRLTAAVKEYRMAVREDVKSAAHDRVRSHAGNLRKHGGKLNQDDLDALNQKPELDSEGQEIKPHNTRAGYTKFYKTGAWRSLRYKALKKYGKRCACCGATPDDGVSLHVDHIVPRSKDRRKELDIDNLQILCEDCNLGKGNTDRIDHRSATTDPRDRVIADLIKYCEELNDQIAILEMGRI